ncbi:MAG: hypothetical protein GX328_03960 [Clostridiaceae bacterium]|nr:hypothetical protein [Clostridiaceae bacterium]
MKNTLGDLNNHLFSQLERLTDGDLTAEELDTEIKRSKVVSNLATKIIDNGELVLKARSAALINMDQQNELPKMLEG